MKRQYPVSLLKSARYLRLKESLTMNSHASCEEATGWSKMESLRECYGLTSWVKFVNLLM